MWEHVGLTIWTILSYQGMETSLLFSFFLCCSVWCYMILGLSTSGCLSIWFWRWPALLGYCLFWQSTTFLSMFTCVFVLLATKVSDWLIDCCCCRCRSRCRRRRCCCYSQNGISVMGVACMFSCRLCQSWHGRDDPRTPEPWQGDDALQLNRASVERQVPRVRLGSGQFRRRTSSAQLFRVVGCRNGEGRQRRRTSADGVSSCRTGTSSVASTRHHLPV